MRSKIPDASSRRVGGASLARVEVEPVVKPGPGNAVEDTNRDQHRETWHQVERRGDGFARRSQQHDPILAPLVDQAADDGPQNDRRDAEHTQGYADQRRVAPKVQHEQREDRLQGETL